MRRQQSVATVIYNHLFPTPGPSDPPNFQTHLARDLIPEIRIETATFYGSLDSIEARYPGLNYCHGPHRMRLGRFPHHARLFKAIDYLGISNQEVMDLVRWEGTLWARQRFERDEGLKVKDTTGDGIVEWVDPRRSKKHPHKGIRIKVETEVEVYKEIDQHADGPIDGIIPTVLNQDMGDDLELDDDDDDDDAAAAGADGDCMEEEHAHEHTEEQQEAEQNVGQNMLLRSQALNHRLITAFLARQQGLAPDLSDAEFEAYLKDLIERGTLPATSRPADGPLFRRVPSTSAPAAGAASASPTIRQPAA